LGAHTSVQSVLKLMGNFGKCTLKLRLEGQTLVVLDYFTPFNQRVLDAKDWDLGSQGPVLLPGAGGHASPSVGGCGEGGQAVPARSRQAGEVSGGVQSIKDG
jgi:hypothetical protein